MAPEMNSHQRGTPVLLDGQTRAADKSAPAPKPLQAYTAEANAGSLAAMAHGANFGLTEANKSSARFNPLDYERFFEEPGFALPPGLRTEPIPPGMRPCALVLLEYFRGPTPSGWIAAWPAGRLFAKADLGVANSIRKLGARFACVEIEPDPNAAPAPKRSKRESETR